MVIEDYKDGGLRMTDLDLCIKAAKIKWIQKYLKCDTQAAWKKSFEYLCKMRNLPIYCLSNYKISELPNTLPIYYKESFRFWKNMKMDKVKCKQDLNDQFVWYNRNM